MFLRNADPSGDENATEIWVMRADGSGERQLTDNEVEDNEPAWSPDGRRIAFHRDTDPAPDYHRSTVEQLLAAAQPDNGVDPRWWPRWSVLLPPLSSTRTRIGCPSRPGQVQWGLT